MNTATEKTEKYWALVKSFGVFHAEDLEGSDWADKFVQAESPSDADAWEALERFIGRAVSFDEFIVASRALDAFELSPLDLPD